MISELCQLKELCDTNVMRVNPALKPDNEFWYIDISSIDNAAKTISTPTRTNGRLASVRARQVVHENDVLVSTTRPNLNSVTLVPKEFHGHVCSTGFCVLRCGDELEPRYLFHFVRSRIFVESLSNLVQGALYPAVTDKQVIAQSIPWVPLINQRKIATLLKAQLGELEKARLAVQVQVNDVDILISKSLDKIFSEFKVRIQIGAVAKIQSGFAFKSESFQPRGVRLLRNANIVPGKVYWNDSVYLKASESHRYPSYTLADGDVLISLDRPIISSGLKVAKVQKEDLPALLVQRVGRFQINKEKLIPDYLYAYLQSNKFISKIAGHDQSLGVPHISPSQVESIEIPLPNLSTQKRIAYRLNEITNELEKVKSALMSQSKNIDILPAKILTQAFEL